LTKDQDRFRKQFANAFTPHGAFEAYQEQARKNLAMFEQAMSVFTPFTPVKGAAGAPVAGQAPTAAVQPDSTAAGKRPDVGATAKSPEAPAPAKSASVPSPAKPDTAASDIAELKAQLASMQAKIEKLSSGGKS
jgi:polyhydroxyalkanoate synthesis regulator protein